jgi:hypothetical protein
MALRAGDRLGVYEISSPIGAGGMGEVYRARDPRLGREVAIKVLPAAFNDDADRLRRFEQEARAAAALNHPNILAVHDIGQLDGTPYIVSELLEGEALRERLNSGALPLRKTVEFGIQMARGLAAAHEKGIVHRDLKPENVFITSDGRVKILDFGLAKLTYAEPTLAGLSVLPTTPPQTQAGLVLGTIGYMAPEQVRGLTADPRSDIFACGAILYEMLSGNRAFHGDTTPETMTAILKEDPPDLHVGARHIPVAMARIVDRCLEKSPAGRFQSAGDLAFALDGVSSQSGEAAAVSATTPHFRRERLAWALTVAMLTLAVAAMVIPATRYLRRAVVEAPEARLDVTTPPTSDPVSLALSPDGRTLAFVASPQGNPQLWLRPLDSMKAEPLAGTERASFPFWSPDSRSIGFFADGKLKRLDMAGGPAQTLATIASPRGATWSADGVMLVSGAPRSIARVSATGGELAALLRLEQGQSFHYFPQFLPDGRHFLYTVVGTPAMSGIYVGTIDGAAGRRLLNAVSTAVYVPTGFLLYVREGTLLAQRFDVQRLTLVGEVFQLADDVAFTPSTGAAAISASALGTITYRIGATGPALAWFDRTGHQLGLVNGPDRAGPLGLELSQDGQRVAVWRTVDGNRDIYLIEATRGITCQSRIANSRAESRIEQRCAAPDICPTLTCT